LFYLFSFVRLERTKGVELYAAEITKLHNEKVEWSGVKQINNIEYLQVNSNRARTLNTQVRVWQSWRIGPGKVYRWSDFENTVRTISPLNVFHSTNVSDDWISDAREKTGNTDMHFLPEMISCLFLRRKTSY